MESLKASRRNMITQNLPKSIYRYLLAVKYDSKIYYMRHYTICFTWSFVWFRARNEYRNSGKAYHMFNSYSLLHTLMRFYKTSASPQMYIWEWKWPSYLQNHLTWLPLQLSSQTDILIVLSLASKEDANFLVGRTSDYPKYQSDSI